MAIVLLVGCTSSTEAKRTSPAPFAPATAESPFEREPQIDREWLETSPPDASTSAASSALPTDVLNASGIRDIVKGAVHALNRCYEDADDVPLYTLSFTIGPDGKVSEASVLASPRAIPFETCMTGVMTRLVFPRPANGGSVKVSYPLH
jgi:hypothetical protein